ncbi:myb-binding protein 1A-like [Athene noctua]|uniref:myb-binding protein 1A-like n=1 Tax=Athene noctua TaxID=126797 RepID=UPI003EBEDF76
MAGREGRGGADAVAVADPRGVLRQGRAFLDFFWDIAKPEQEVRLAATESLLRHLRDGGKAEELEYTLRRLVEGLGATREAARPGFSLALAQMPSSARGGPMLEQVAATEEGWDSLEAHTGAVWEELYPMERLNTGEVCGALSCFYAPNPIF